MSDLKETIRKIAEDLTNLEVNTVIKPNMTGGKMPHPRHALITIAQEYGNKLEAISNKLPQEKRPSNKKFDVGGGTFDFSINLYTPKPNSHSGKTRHIYTGSYYYFDYLRKFACKVLEDLKTMQYAERDADVVMLYRIRDVSDQIKGVFNAFRKRTDTAGADLKVDSKTIKLMRTAAENVGKARKNRALQQPDLKYSDEDFKVEIWDNNYTREEIETERPPFDLTADELVTIRKAWEIGTEVIVMQTVIQLDGDVVSRVDPEYATSEKASIQAIHDKSVALSLSAWSQLIGLVKDFFENIVKFFAPKKL